MVINSLSLFMSGKSIFILFLKYMSPMFLFLFMFSSLKMFNHFLLAEVVSDDKLAVTPQYLTCLCFSWLIVTFSL